MSKTVAQIIAGDEVLTKLLNDLFLWSGRPYSVDNSLTQLMDKLRDEYGITFEIYT